MEKNKLSSIFSDGMVLQRGDKTKIFGTTVENSKIEVWFLGEKYETVSNDKGKWSILLNKLEAGGPYEMVIKGAEEITIKDILIGDVWLCSGQSNMELPIERVMELYEDEILNYNNSNIRQFCASKNYVFNGPKDDLDEGSWKVLNQDNSLEFTAVGYFFAKEIYEKYKVPIGIIATAVGGTPIESWINEADLKKFNRFEEIIRKCKDSEYVSRVQEQDDNRINNWYEELNLNDEGLINLWNLEGFDDSDWGEFVIPGMWKDTCLDKVNGSVWFRKEIFLSDEAASYNAKLYLGSIIDSDEVYVNGVLVGKTEYRYPPRIYKVDNEILKVGRNIITIRVMSNTGIGGFIKDKQYKLAFENEEIDLSGGWKYKIGHRMDFNYDRTFFQFKPIGFYNSIIHPLRKYAIAGVLWYQGESNTGYPNDYEELFETLINRWRENWNNEYLPFLYVQLANYLAPEDSPLLDNWAKLREAQRRGLRIKNTGMAVSVDIGEYNDLHPLNKKEVGRRLALLAQDKVYNEKNISVTPMYKKMNIEGNKIVIHFSNSESGLISIKGNLNNFEISDEYGRFYKANAQIKGNLIEVWSNKVSNPVNVRYAWKNSPHDINLYNREGLPISPFTTEINYL